MPRRPRITEIGFHHIISRGVERRNIFIDDACFEKFLGLLSDVSIEYDLQIHTFCLMRNHYHILLETKSENLSDAVKKLNSHYATWFNSTYNRSGHLWQGRYLSYYIYNDTHFWTVAKYIERNPVAANATANIDGYVYQSYYMRLHPNHPYSAVVKNSKIIEMNLGDYKEFISTPMSAELKKQVYDVPRPNKDSNGKTYLEKPIASFFECEGARNEKIQICYKYGYTKAAIAQYLGLSPMAISKILR
jgi:putative transposase